MHSQLSHQKCSDKASLCHWCDRTGEGQCDHSHLFPAAWVKHLQLQWIIFTYPWKSWGHFCSPEPGEPTLNPFSLSVCGMDLWRSLVHLRGNLDSMQQDRENNLGGYFLSGQWAANMDQKHLQWGCSDRVHTPVVIRVRKASKVTERQNWRSIMKEGGKGRFLISGGVSFLLIDDINLAEWTVIRDSDSSSGHQMFLQADTSSFLPPVHRDATLQTCAADSSSLHAQPN